VVGLPWFYFFDYLEFMGTLFLFSVLVFQPGLVKPTRELFDSDHHAACDFDEQSGSLVSAPMHEETKAALGEARLQGGGRYHFCPRRRASRNVGEDS